MKVLVSLVGASAGSDVCFPLVKVGGKTLAEHAIGLFPPDSEFVFVCRADDLSNPELPGLMRRLSPDGLVVPFQGSGKEYFTAVAQAAASWGDRAEVTVAESGFHMEWDFPEFASCVHSAGTEIGVAVCQGFHPHLAHGRSPQKPFGLEETGVLVASAKAGLPSGTSTDWGFPAGVCYFRQGGLLRGYATELAAGGEDAVAGDLLGQVLVLAARDRWKAVFYPEVVNYALWRTDEERKEFHSWETVFARD